MVTPTSKIWRNGEWIAWDDAKVHILTHALHYGTSVFEGIRCYETKQGPGIFRLPEHVRRMYDSSKIYRMEIKAFERAQIAAACVELV
jgi:branched-chain amino acid aminotransferase